MLDFQGFENLEGLWTLYIAIRKLAKVSEGFGNVLMKISLDRPDSYRDQLSPNKKNRSLDLGF